MIDRNQLIKDYAKIIDNQIEEILRLKGVRDKCIQELYEIEQILGKALNYPWLKDDQKNFPLATEKDGVCVGPNTACSLAMEAADRIKQLNRTCSDLRKELADPSADIQEYVLQKLNIYQQAADSTKMILDLQKENEDLRAELQNYRNLEAAKAKAIQEKQFVSKEEALAQYNLIKARSKRNERL